MAPPFKILQNCPTQKTTTHYKVLHTLYICQKKYYTYNVSDMHTMYIMQAKSEDNKIIDKSNMNPRAGTKLVNIGTRTII